MEGFEITGPSFVVTGTTEEELENARQGTKQQIAFYGSTPAYRGVLDLHGWGGLQDELNALSKQGEWVKMGELIDDEILNTFAVVGEPEEIAPELLKRYGDCITRVSWASISVKPSSSSSRPTVIGSASIWLDGPTTSDTCSRLCSRSRAGTSSLAALPVLANSAA